MPLLYRLEMKDRWKYPQDTCYTGRSGVTSLIHDHYSKSQMFDEVLEMDHNHYHKD